MMDPLFVERFEQKLREQAEGLLKGGSSYSNIFTGGAQESHFCWANLGWNGILHALNPVFLPLLVILYIDIFVRTLGLLVVEFALAVPECIKGALKGRSLIYEFRFVWLRVLVCIFLREIMVAGVCMDIMRGMPVIHLNFLGYDEQAHCRGPSSKYAHWSLQGIDDAIRRIHNVMRQSPNRVYDIWIYGDHGQENTIPYFIRYGITVEEAVERVLGAGGRHKYDTLTEQRKKRQSHAGLLKRKKPENKLGMFYAPPLDFKDKESIVTVMGPLGHVYVKKNLQKEEIAFYGEKLALEAKIPLVMARAEKEQVIAWTKKGVFILPEQLKEVFGLKHPFLNEFKEDLIRICHHNDAGEFIIAGWVHGEVPMSLSLEYGAHGGMGTEETGSFAMLPWHAPLKKRLNYIRPIDLHEAAQKYLRKFFGDTIDVHKSNGRFRDVNTCLPNCSNDRQSATAQSSYGKCTDSMIFAVVCNLIDVCSSNIKDFKKTNVEILAATINLSLEKASK